MREYKSVNLREFNKFKNQARADYQKIGKVFSPALKSEIIFNSNGFHHLRYDNNRSERSKSAQKNKFLFIRDAVEIIKKSTTVQEYRQLKRVVKYGKTSIVEWFAFFAIISFHRRVRIKAVVRRVGGKNGQYHFWSVMPFWNLNKNGRVVGLKEIEDK